MRARSAKCRTARTRTQNVVLLAAAMVMMAVGVLPATPLGETSALAAEEAKAEPTAKAAKEKAAPAKAEPITLDDYLAGISKAGDSASAQVEFAKKHDGTIVTWPGYLGSVTKNLSPNGTEYLLVVKTKLAEEEGKANQIYYARFPDAAATQVLALQTDQKITITGKLAASQSPAKPTVMDAKLSGS